MKTAKIIFLLSCFCSSTIVTIAQNAANKDTLYLGSMAVVINSKPAPPKDTLYYFLDLSKTPVNDRMITVDSESVYKFYKINCPCLEGDLNPVFRCNKNLKAVARITNLHFISLPELINKAKTQGFNNFNKTQALFFIIPANNSYFKYKAFLEDKPREPSIDIMTVPKQ